MTRLPMRPVLIALFLVVSGALVSGALAAQDEPTPAVGGEVARLSAALEASKRDHLWRVAIWGGANVALGIGLLAGANRDRTPKRFGFGVQSAAWGAINLGIVGVSMLSGDPEIAASLPDALAAENGWSDVLLVNLGLNVGYMGVGTALAIAAGQGLSRADEVRGHAYGVIVQGTGLFVLDGIAWLASRGRLDTLMEMASSARLGVLPLDAVDPASGEAIRAVSIAIGIPIG